MSVIRPADPPKKRPSRLEVQLQELQVKYGGLMGLLCRVTEEEKKTVATAKLMPTRLRLTS